MPRRDPAADAEYRAKNRERLRAQARAYYLANKPRLMAEHKKRVAANRHRYMVARKSVLYGVPKETIEALLAVEACEVCGSPRGTAWHERLRIDHCHAGGGVRGVLCNGCNVGIGHFRNSPARLRAAADYLEIHAILGAA